MDYCTEKVIQIMFYHLFYFSFVEGKGKKAFNYGEYRPDEAFSFQDRNEKNMRGLQNETF